MLRKTLLLLLVLLVLVKGSHSIYFAPPTVDITAKPGETVKFKLTIINDTTVELLCQLYITDIQKTKEGRLLFPPIKTTHYSCGEYINLEETQITLAPNELKEITCNLKVLPSAAAGSKHAVIMCQPTPKDMPEELRRTTPGIRLGSIVNLLIEGRVRKSINVKELEFNPATQKELRSISFVVENKSDIRIAKGSGFLTIIDDKKRVVDRISLDLKPSIYPQTEQIFKIHPQRYLPSGSYTANVLVNYEDIRAVSTAFSFYITEEEKELQQKQVKSTFGQLLAVSLNPPELSLDLPAGSFRTYPIELNNQENMNLDVEVKLCDVVSTATCGFEYTKLGSTHYTFEGMVNINPKKFTIPPRSTKKIIASLKLPPSEKLYAPAFYGGILFNLKASGKDFVLEDKLKLNLSLLVKDKPTEASGSITQVYIKSGESLFFEIYFKNTGNIALAPVSLSITVKDKLFKDVLQMTDKIDYLMPGEIHKFTLERNLSLEDDQYLAYITVNFLKDQYVKVKKEFEIKKISGSITQVYIEPSEKSLFFEIYFKNTGNIALAPVSLSITVKDKLFKDVLQMTDKIDHLMPGKIHKFRLKHDLKETLNPDKYLAYITVNFLKDQYVKVKKEFEIKKIKRK